MADENETPQPAPEPTPEPAKPKRGRPRKDEPPRPKKIPNPEGRPRKVPKPPPAVPDPVTGIVPPVELTDAERAYLNEYLIDHKKIAAYLRLYPTVTRKYASHCGNEILKRPHVAEELKAAKRDAAIRCQVKADSNLKEIAAIAHSDIADYVGADNRLLPIRLIGYEARKAIKSIRVRREAVTVRVTRRTKAGVTTETNTTVHEQELEYQLWDKLKALQILNGYLGLDQGIPDLGDLLSALPPDIAAQTRWALANPGQKQPLQLPPHNPQPPEGNHG